MWYLLVGLARYMFVGGLWLRRYLEKPVYQLPENSARRPFAGAQMGFAAVVLFPVFSPPGTFLAAGLFAVPFLVGFLLDWFSVSGISIKELVRQTHFLGKIDELTKILGMQVARLTIREWIPLFVRAILVILLIYWFQANSWGLLQSIGNSTVRSFLPDLQSFYWIIVLLGLIFVGLVFTAVGIAGRVAALLVLIGLGMYLELFQLRFIEISLVFAAMGLFYLGTGPYSLWNAERKIITQRLGET
jgi:CDP-diacylglycerol--glycerol-3-phosphate 3-phosphatidyltransferase